MSYSDYYSPDGWNEWEGPDGDWQAEREDDRTDEDDPQPRRNLDQPDPLWDFFCDEHGLTLTEGQLSDIAEAVRKYWGTTNQTR